MKFGEFSTTLTSVLAVAAVVFVYFEKTEAIADNTDAIVEQESYHESDIAELDEQIQNTNLQVQITNENLNELIQLEKQKQLRISDKHQMRVEDCENGVFSKKECRQRFGIRVE